MEWYEDDDKLNHVAVYGGEADALREAQRAALKGWVPRGSVLVPGQVDPWRTALKASLLVPYLLSGPSRRPDSFAVTFVRTQEWQERRQSGRTPAVVAS